MRSSKFETCTFCPNTFFKYLTSHYRLNNKPICKECRSNLTTRKYSITPNPSPTPHITTYITSQIQERCSLHLTSKHFYCNTCNTSLCFNCLSDHSSHQTTTLDSAYQILQKKLTWLTRILTTHVKLNSYRPKSLIYLLKSLKASTECIYSLPLPERILKFGRIIHTYYSKFKRIYHEYNNLSLESAFSFTQSLSASSSLETFNYYTWLEWGSGTIHLLDLKTNSCSTKGIRREFKIPYYSRSLILPDGRIFISGGKLDLSACYTSGGWILDIKTREVEEIESMKTGRSNHCLVYLRDFIYALGGCNHLNQITSSCERYCMLSKKWREMPNAIHEIDSASAVAIDHLNIILVFGGRQYAICNSAIQKFDAIRNYWSIVSIEPVLSRYLLGAILIPQEGSKILIFGGLGNGRNPSLDCYLFDYESNELVPTGSLHECLTTVSPPSLFQDYVISSESLSFNVRLFYRYDIRNKVWITN